MSTISINPQTVEAIKKISSATVHPTTKTKIKSMLTGVALSVTCLCSANMIHSEDINFNKQTIIVKPVQTEQTPGEKFFENPEAMYKMATWIHDKYGMPTQMSYEIVQNVVESSILLGQDPFLILAIIDVESKFNPNAVSNKNAQGIIQVNANVHKSTKGLTIQKQIEAGIGVLLDVKYVYKTTDIVELLQRYNGNIKDTQTIYANKVLATKEVFEELIINDLNIEYQYDILSQTESFPLEEAQITHLSKI